MGQSSCSSRSSDAGTVRLPSRLSARLEIELSEPTSPISDALENQKAPAAATIKSARLVVSMVEGNVLRDPTEEELNQIACNEPQIQLQGYGDVVSHRAPNGENFRVRGLLSAIEETERRTRHQREWFGGVDVHHVFFEGLEREAGGVWQISWGS